VDARASRAGRPAEPVYDVAVVGGGPAGAVMGWALALRGVRAVVLERERFPREKVCGDFVEPRGLRLLHEMGCLGEIEASSPLPITDVAMFLESACEYRGRIPFYEQPAGLPTYGYIVPRHELDTRMLECARRAGAAVFEGSAVTGLSRTAGAFTLSGRRDGAPMSVRARLVVGADGAHSIVARTAGLLRDDPRHTAVSQRVYVDGIDVGRGEAAFFFDRDLFPGYGWMFPMSGGRANVGVGILSETRNRLGISVRGLLQAFLEKLRRQHGDCRHARLASKPLGGIVRTYGGAGPNYFDGGILIGDAGCFVDPMTGEGITPAMESAVIGASVLADAVAAGRFNAAQLSTYEGRFRRYFDPAMRYVDFCAAVMRNRFLRDFWLRLVARGCQRAREDREFARIAGAAFGGLDVQPLSILSHLWAKLIDDVGTTGVRAVLDAVAGRPPSRLPWLDDLWTFADGWWRSALDDPSWHGAWTADVLQKWALVASTLYSPGDPRMDGPLLRLA
jgi:geranylgeranyl reductase family protein